jgi:hypothetical protein
VEPQPSDVVPVPGPLESAWAWLECVVESGDLDAAWPATDPNLRLALVQSWIWNNRTRPPVSAWNREELARALTPDRPGHPLWSVFAPKQVEKLRAWWGNPDLDAWGASIKARVVPSDYELIRFTPMDTRPGSVPKPPSKREGRLVLLRGTPEGWVVSGFDRQPPTPGWPPKG